MHRIPQLLLLKIRQLWPLLLDSTLNSYGQLFFSQNRVLSVMVMAASFTNWEVGRWGLPAIWLTHALAWIAGFDKSLIRGGMLGLNSLLVVFGLALLFQVNVPFLLLLVAACMFTLVIGIALHYGLSHWGIPILSLPFVLGIWMMEVASRQFALLEWSTGSIYTLNELYKWGGSSLVQAYEVFLGLQLPSLIEGYLRSLAAILFQNNWFAGLFIALGLLVASRILFSLSVMGFLLGYGSQWMLGMDLATLNYGALGFNYVLTTLALGGYFFIPNAHSYGLAMAVIPLVMTLNAGFSEFAKVFQVPIYSLPFALATGFMMYVIKFSNRTDVLAPVLLQLRSPEENLYAYQNQKQRFKGFVWQQIHLPFYGTWRVSQGHNGGITHREHWQYAWDFDQTDAEGRTFEYPGTHREDYYCYNLPVLAPTNGVVVAVQDHIPENEIGKVNLVQNWGNTVIIQHTEGLYSKLSHLKGGTVCVKVGDVVQTGQRLGVVGNSGRSPEPHLHFQLQTTPYIGAATLRYPIAAYLTHTAEGIALRQYCYPEEGEQISAVQSHASLAAAFAFVPGQTVSFQREDKDGEVTHWQVETDAWNKTCFHEVATGARAYFVNDGTVFYFTHYEGDRKSDLFAFYMGCHKVLLAFYRGVSVFDELPLHQIWQSPRRWISDFWSPFYVAGKATFAAINEASEEVSQDISICSSVELFIRSDRKQQYAFKTEIVQGHITAFSGQFGTINLTLRRIFPAL
ncbi:MAG TPA: urea transporter [Rhodothermales bacterium]|nr:urea transporter [Rhodothermales bacterium]